MKDSELSNKSVLGVKGITPLVKIPKFDASICAPVDFMHCVCLGVVKYMAEIWFDSKNNKHQFYLGLKIKRIDKTILELNPYSEIPRYPKEISQRSKWKANEWLNWLLYFSNPCLMQNLPNPYLIHFQKLRKAIRILLGNDLQEAKLVKCNKLLRKFVKQFQELYGQQYMVYNVHLILHLVDSVRSFGPLWGFSLFPYENLNGFLKGFVKGPKEPLIQINTKYHMFHQLNYDNVSNVCRKEITQFCSSVMRSGITIKTEFSGIWII